jgi:hypothetical protein
VTERIPWTHEGLQRWADLIHRDLDVPFGDVDRLRDVVRYLPAGVGDSWDEPIERRTLMPPSRKALEAAMRERDEARTENAALLARVEEAERDRDDALVSSGDTILRAAKGFAEFEALRAEVATLRAEIELRDAALAEARTKLAAELLTEMTRMQAENVPALRDLGLDVEARARSLASMFVKEAIFAAGLGDVVDALNRGRGTR